MKKRLALDFFLSNFSNTKLPYADSWGWNNRDNEVALGAAPPHDEADLFSGG